MKMEVVRFSETPVLFYQIAGCQISGDSTLKFELILFCQQLVVMIIQLNTIYFTRPITESHSIDTVNYIKNKQKHMATSTRPV
jgi:hypothetical protein